MFFIFRVVCVFRGSSLPRQPRKRTTNHGMHGIHGPQASARMDEGSGATSRTEDTEWHRGARRVKSNNSVKRRACPAASPRLCVSVRNRNPRLFPRHSAFSIPHSAFAASAALHSAFSIFLSYFLPRVQKDPHLPRAGYQPGDGVAQEQHGGRGPGGKHRP